MKQLTLIKTVKCLIIEGSEYVTFFRRRISAIDNLVKTKIKQVYTPDKLCIYKDDIEFVKVVIYAVAETFYYSYLIGTGLDDDSEEWSMIFLNIDKYIMEKYGEELKKYYHINCGD